MRVASVLLLLAVMASPTPHLLAGGPDSVDGHWSKVESVPFPRHVSPPTAYAAARLDLPSFLEGIASPDGRDVAASLLLPDGRFVRVKIRPALAMAADLAAVFADLQTFTFASEDGEVSGRLSVGPGGLYVFGQAPNRLLRIEPVQTARGVFYVSFFDCDRTDTVTIAALPRF